MPGPIVVHGLEHLRAALRAARALAVPLRAVSAPGGAGMWGGSAFAAMVAAARAEFPEVRFSVALDGGDQPGRVLNALRHGVDEVTFAGHSAARNPLIALGAQPLDKAEPSLDLMGIADPETACRAWLSKAPSP